MDAVMHPVLTVYGAGIAASQLERFQHVCCLYRQFYAEHVQVCLFCSLLVFSRHLLVPPANAVNKKVHVD